MNRGSEVQVDLVKVYLKHTIGWKGQTHGALLADSKRVDRVR